MDEFSLLNILELQETYRTSRLESVTMTQELQTAPDDKQAILSKELTRINDLMRAIEVEAQDRNITLP